MRFDPPRLRRILATAVLLVPFALRASSDDEGPVNGTLHWEAETGG